MVIHGLLALPSAAGQRFWVRLQHSTDRGVEAGEVNVISRDL